jgi:hypothetical protein
MPAYALTHVADEKLLADLGALVSEDRQTTAMLTAHIAEVDARELFKAAACTSMHAYCTRFLHLSEDAAFKRIRAARAGRQFPQIFEAIADGRLHLSGVGLLAAHLTEANVDQLIAAATHRSKLEIEMLLARLAPRADVPESVAPIVPPQEPLCTDSQAPGPVADAAPAPPPRVTPLAPERFALQLTISGDTRGKLERARALLRHRNPSGDLATVVDLALDALLVTLEQKKFGKVSRPRAGGARSESADLRYVSSEVRRAVHARDGEQCTFVAENGERCCERGFLEFDHRNPVALGGAPTVENLRLLCRPHNQYEAERKLGAEVVRAARRRRKPGDRRKSEHGSGTAQATRVDAHASPDGGHAQPWTPASDTTGAVSAVTSGVSATTSSADSAESDRDLALALRGLGFKSEQARMALTVAPPATGATFEERLRAALAVLTRSRSSRCSDGPFDALA